MRWIGTITSLISSVIIGAAAFLGVIYKQFWFDEQIGPLIGLSITWALNVYLFLLMIFEISNFFHFGYNNNNHYFF